MHTPIFIPRNSLKFVPALITMPESLKVGYYILYVGGYFSFLLLVRIYRSVTIWFCFVLCCFVFILVPCAGYRFFGIQSWNSLLSLQLFSTILIAYSSRESRWTVSEKLRLGVIPRAIWMFPILKNRVPTTALCMRILRRCPPRTWSEISDEHGIPFDLRNIF